MELAGQQPRRPLSIDDFEIVKPIAKGAFGSVSLNPLFYIEYYHYYYYFF